MENNNNGIVWIVKEKSGVTSNADVSLRVHKTNGKDKTTFIFRNQSHEKITHTEYMNVGIDYAKKRVYFAEGMVTTAFKVQGANGKPRLVKIPAPLHEHIGDYRLAYDPISQIYYIDLENKEVM